MIAVLKRNQQKRRALEFQVNRSEHTDNEGLSVDNTSLADVLPLKYSTKVDLQGSVSNVPISPIEVAPSLCSATMLGNMPHPAQIILEKDMELLSISGKWVPRRIVLTNDYILLLRVEDGDLKDRIPLMELVAVHKLADAASIRKNSGIFSFENILMAERLCCLELVTLCNGYNSGRRLYLRHENDATCDEWRDALLAASRQATRMFRRRSPNYWVEVPVPPHTPTFARRIPAVRDNRSSHAPWRVA